MKELKFTLKITLDRFIVNNPYLGAVTLKLQGREYILDVCQSYTYDDEDCAGATEIQCDLESGELDKDTFPDCKFDLTKEDLLNEDIFAEFYINGEDEDFEVECIVLMFEIDGEQKSIKVIED